VRRHIHGWIAAAVVFAPTALMALGFRIPNQDAAAIARANAFVATADNPSALYYNPAGITQLEGHQVQFGMHALSVNSTFVSPTGARSKTKGTFQPVPQLYYTYNPKNHPLAYGIGVYAPYGLAIRWPEANQSVRWRSMPNFSTPRSIRRSSGR